MSLRPNETVAKVRRRIAVVKRNSSEMHKDATDKPVGRAIKTISTKQDSREMSSTDTKPTHDFRDEIGGANVNLVPSDKPQDIYKVVADKTILKLEAAVSVAKRNSCETEHLEDEVSDAQRYPTPKDRNVQTSRLKGLSDH